MMIVIIAMIVIAIALCAIVQSRLLIGRVLSLQPADLRSRRYTEETLHRGRSHRGASP